MAGGVTERFKSLNYRRDQAGHGAASTISEIEAFHAILRMLRLLRLAQFASDHWATLTV